MAKSPKKPTDAKEPATGPKKRAATKKTAASAKPAAKSSMTIDTGLAAQAAARMLRAQQSGLAGTPATGGSAPRESNAFKQLKDNMGKHAGLNQMLDSTASANAQRSNQPFGNVKQVGHNQTYGTDASRRNIPRRTSGG